MDKRALLDTWREILVTRRQTLLAARGNARSGTRVDGTHRPENRGERAAVTAQGYLTAGLSQRLSELDAALEVLDRMDGSPRTRAVTGAVVTLDDVPYAILPGGDGQVIAGVRVVSPESPVARAVWSCEEEDEVSFRGEDRVITSIL